MRGQPPHDQPGRVVDAVGRKLLRDPVGEIPGLHPGLSMLRRQLQPFLDNTAPHVVEPHEPSLAESELRPFVANREAASAMNVL